MKNIYQWINRIKSASTDELDQIKSEWSIEGRKYKSVECGDFWCAFNDRKLELQGIDKNQPPF